MKTVKCDRCGKDIPYSPMFPFLNVTQKDGYIPPSLTITKWDSFNQCVSEVDLCNDCRVEVYNYIFDHDKSNGA